MGGQVQLRWALPSIAFLIFMIPLPYRVEAALGSRLQRLATLLSTYALQVCGLPAFRSGNTIIINDYSIGIVDACNGLGASYVVLACAVGAALMIHRPLSDRIILIVSAIPIALVANVTRITLTGLLHQMIGKGAADTLYHDVANWLSMPLALVLLYIEYQFLLRLFIETRDATPFSADSIEESPLPGEPSVPEVRMSRVIPILASILLVLSSGIIHGFWINRWIFSREIELAVSRLDRVPMVIGEWKGRPEAMDRRQWIGAGLDGLVMRHYENSRTGRTTSLILACGRPGPVSVHTPEICYPGSGRELAHGPPVKFSVSPDGRSAEFLKADFERRESFSPQCLRVYWSWNATGTWSVPDNPRLAFAPRPFLYKLHLVSRTIEGLERYADDAQTEFLRQLLPELEKSLFPRVSRH